MTVVRKHSVSIRGHRTSFSLEQPFLDELERIARSRGLSLAALVAEIDDRRAKTTNLSSALRLHVLACLKAAGDQDLDDPHGR
ncbi:ribbon-helix-helix domain-containing protein [Aquibium sp. LZ166]|uniref:Ribbon-helix-helix domain-containing protein n=1 Tax=Aquibium pacificus TaxID=3153579 RepID=A0ABV3SF62_9HYPH